MYRWAVETVVSGVGQLLDKAGLTPSTLDWFVPHSANARIIEAVSERLGIPRERTLSSIEWYGNTSAATIPLALAPALKDGRVTRGQTVLMYGFGGGLVHAGAVVDW